MHTNRQGLYPDYDVLALQDEWDDHTREIVNKRLGPFQFKLLTQWERDMIKTVGQHLIYDNREEILDWIAAHVDHKLNSPLGEGQRKPKTPPQKILIRDGLKALDNWAKHSFSTSFISLEMDQQFQIISSLQFGWLEQLKDWDEGLQKDLFKKLVGLVVDAYYSHPWVWSEIGYGGPAYPRGYVRVGLGLTDPWEPKGGT